MTNLEMDAIESEARMIVSSEHSKPEEIQSAHEILSLIADVRNLDRCLNDLVACAGGGSC